MGTAERRERQRQGLREKILEAARELFAECGYEAVSMRKIAERIEYSPTTIYLYFKDKDALVRELCGTDFRALGSRFAALAKEPDPVKRLRGIGRAYIRFAKDHPNHYRMMFMTPSPAVPVNSRGIEKGDPMQDAWAFVTATVKEAMDRGLLAPDEAGPEVVAQTFFAGVHGVASLAVAKANDPWINWAPLEKQADRMIDSLLRAASPPARRR
ncbi:MAG TPA: TetR/AcrR family transcriptional regulator [Polyangia bacterium]